MLRILLVVVLLVSGCGGGAQKFNSVDITGANYARDFALTDHTGARRTLADYRGKVVAVFFGFTQCPDVCPTTLSDLAQVRKRLGSDGERLQVIFITVDPERDSQTILQRYVPSFDPSFVALYGSAEQTAATAKEFKVSIRRSGAGLPPRIRSITRPALTSSTAKAGCACSSGTERASNLSLPI